ncbi:flagellin N-terminal helical domain-containing protein [Geobacter pickeringii]|uniref:Flagellin n=1 Tax=Geobacter pickeringii TaxID=345632 RepID=A0A0B5B7A4_9BACT|nr:flagellin [Geobacter pickeringii]AJE02398.1 flagellin [Geobacter pickeringii]
MALTVNTNIASLNAQRNLSTTQTALNRSLQRLSSGLRINSAADDAAGLAISEGMRSQIRSMNQAVRNANDGVSLVQTAEGALNEVSNILQRMRELATQSATGTVSSDQRSYINNEFTQLKSEIDRIASATQFNGTSLFTSTAGQTVSFQVGPGATTNDTIAVTISAAGSSSIGVGTASVSGATGAAATAALTAIDSAITNVSNIRGTLGAVQNRLQSTINNLQVSVENLSAAESRIRDVDVASETAALTRAQILTQAGTSILSQANQTPQSALSLLR